MADMDGTIVLEACRGRMCQWLRSVSGLLDTRELIQSVILTEAEDGKLWHDMEINEEEDGDMLDNDQSSVSTAWIPSV